MKGNEMTKEELQKKFAEEYAELVKKHGYQIAFQPIWKQSMDTGTFSLQIQAVIIENPKANG